MAVRGSQEAGAGNWVTSDITITAPATAGLPACIRATCLGTPGQFFPFDWKASRTLLIRLEPSGRLSRPRATICRRRGDRMWRKGQAVVGSEACNLARLEDRYGSFAAVPSKSPLRRVHPRKRPCWRRAVTSALGHFQTLA